MLTISKITLQLNFLAYGIPYSCLHHHDNCIHLMAFYYYFFVAVVVFVLFCLLFFVFRYYYILYFDKYFTLNLFIYLLIFIHCVSASVHPLYNQNSLFIDNEYFQQFGYLQQRENWLVVFGILFDIFSQH